MNDALRNHKPGGGSPIEQLRHHGISVSDMARAALAADDGADDQPPSATRMLEWMRKTSYPSLPEISEPAD